MEPRIESPALSVPGARQALMRLDQSTLESGVPETTYELIKLRAGQINGCSACVDIHSRLLRAAGEPDERIVMVAAWRETPYYSDAERAALALAEAVTRIADRADAVPDDVWEEAVRHYDEGELAALVLSIAAINAWNRLNVATGQVTGPWVEQFLAGRAA